MDLSRRVGPASYYNAHCDELVAAADRATTEDLIFPSLLFGRFEGHSDLLTLPVGAKDRDPLGSTVGSREGDILTLPVGANDRF